MLAKITRGHQVTIPKEIVEKAHLKEGSPYVEVEYLQGVIMMRPVVVEERVPPEHYEKFQAWAVRQEKGDLRFDSPAEGIEYFKKRLKKR